MEFFFMTILPIACIVLFVVILVVVALMLTFFVLSYALWAVLEILDRVLPERSRETFRAFGRRMRLYY